MLYEPTLCSCLGHLNAKALFVSVGIAFDFGYVSHTKIPKRTMRELIPENLLSWNKLLSEHACTVDTVLMLHAPLILKTRNWIKMCARIRLTQMINSNHIIAMPVRYLVHQLKSVFRADVRFHFSDLFRISCSITPKSMTNFLTVRIYKAIAYSFSELTCKFSAAGNPSQR